MRPFWSLKPPNNGMVPAESNSETFAPITGLPVAASTTSMCRSCALARVATRASIAAEKMNWSRIVCLKTRDQGRSFPLGLLLAAGAHYEAIATDNVAARDLCRGEAVPGGERHRTAPQLRVARPDHLDRPRVCDSVRKHHEIDG